MTEAEYRAAPGLSNSGLKDLEMSPLRYWFKHINPKREPEEDTPEMNLGTALHVAVLERDDFEFRYVSELKPPEETLYTIDDMRQWLKDKGAMPRGTKKSDMISQVQAVDPHFPIFDVQQARHAEVHKGKTILKLEDWDRVRGCAAALLNEPHLEMYLKEGVAECPLFVTHPEFKIALKCKLDWYSPSVILDLKTFSVKRAKSVDKTVVDAIFYERYYRQAYFYSMMRALVEGDHSVSGAQTQPPFVLAFVESEPPHEVRIRWIRPKTAGSPNMLWERGRIEVQSMMRVYAQYLKTFGEKPWRYPQEVDPVADEEISGLAFS
jgi:PDDEXK-like domain of unknown function (DUF3799)